MYFSKSHKQTDPSAAHEARDKDEEECETVACG